MRCSLRGCWNELPISGRTLPVNIRRSLAGANLCRKSSEWEPSMNANRALWEKGDFTRIAASMRDSGEALVNTLGITRGLKVLDLGCGDGTTALPAARL